jgi:hypothetical protein
LFFLLISFIYGSESLSLVRFDKVLAETPSVGADKSPVTMKDFLPQVKANPDPATANFSLAVKKSAGLLSQIEENPKTFMAAMQNLDNDALRNIITLLEELKAASEARENSLVDELSTTSAAVADAAVNVVEKEGVLSSAQQAAAAANQAVAAAQTDLDDARDDHAAKEGDQASAQTAHDAELPDLNNEQRVLGEVINMLYDLLDDTPTESVLDSDWVIGAKGATCTATCPKGCDDSRWPLTQADFEAIYASENLSNQMVCTAFNTGSWTINPAVYPGHGGGCWTTSSGSDRCSRSHPDVYRWCPCL